MVSIAALVSHGPLFLPVSWLMPSKRHGHPEVLLVLFVVGIAMIIDPVMSSGWNSKPAHQYDYSLTCGPWTGLQVAVVCHNESWRVVDLKKKKGRYETGIQHVFRLHERAILRLLDTVLLLLRFGSYCWM